jgi:uncharacterized protein YndB with AHSA1/START domain
MADRTRGYAHRVDVKAPCEHLWRALTDPVLLALWCAPEAHIDARPGGSYSVRLDRSTERVAHIDVFQPPSRLRLIYMPQSNWPSAEGVVVDDFILQKETECTVVRLLGSGMPEHRSWDAAYAQLRDGWGRALLRLKVTVEKAMATQVQLRGSRSAG